MHQARDLAMSSWEGKHLVAIVHMQGIGKTSAPDGQRLVLAIMGAGVDILHRCGGNARCTTCRVEILDGDPGRMTDVEREKLATLDDVPENMRLSCQVRCCEDLTVKILRRLAENTDMDDAGPQPDAWPLVCPKNLTGLNIRGGDFDIS